MISHLYDIYSTSTITILLFHFLNSLTSAFRPSQLSLPPLLYPCQSYFNRFLHIVTTCIITSQTLYILHLTRIPFISIFSQPANHLPKILRAPWIHVSILIETYCPSTYYHLYLSTFVYISTNPVIHSEFDLW